MMKIRNFLTVLAISATFASAQVAKPIELPYYDYPMVKSDHYEEAAQYCLICHSFGYILNQGKKSRPYWTGTVNKMVNEFKAPIPKEDQQIIINYLVKNYGDGK
jgi:hypothetical protein